MKELALTLCFASFISVIGHSQFMVAKLLGHQDANYGLGYGIFTYLDFPLAAENQSLRVELVDFSAFPLKGEDLFTTYGDVKGGLSIKLGYKYVFSETSTGFYLEPSGGWCRVAIAKQGEQATAGNGMAGALEGGYSFEVNEKGHHINLGLKYESTMVIIIMLCRH